MWGTASLLVPPDYVFFSTGGRSHSSTVPTPFIPAYFFFWGLLLKFSLDFYWQLEIGVRPALLLRFFPNVQIAAVQKYGKMENKPP